MADNEEGDENVQRENDGEEVEGYVPHGNDNEEGDFEVVQLTASTYAAAPSPKDDVLKHDGKDNLYGEDEAETSHALFMSNHFVFPPTEHENLPIGPEDREIVDEQAGKHVASDSVAEKGDKSSGKGEENSPLKGLNVSEDYPGISLFEDKGKHYEESKTLGDLNLDDKHQSIYSSDTFNSFHGESGLGGSTTYGEIVPEHEHSQHESDLPADSTHSPNAAKDDKLDESNLPCEAWWKRSAASLYSHAREANAFWSVFIAAAVMGIVILGQRWQQERWQVLQLKWQASINSEKSGRLLGPLYRLQDAIVGGRRRGSFIRGSSSNDN